MYFLVGYVLSVFKLVSRQGREVFTFLLTQIALYLLKPRHIFIVKLLHSLSDHLHRGGKQASLGFYVWVVARGEEQIGG